MSSEQLDRLLHAREMLSTGRPQSVEERGVEPVLPSAASFGNWVNALRLLHGNYHLIDDAGGPEYPTGHISQTLLCEALNEAGYPISQSNLHETIHGNTAPRDPVLFIDTLCSLLEVPESLRTLGETLYVLAHSAMKFPPERSAAIISRTVHPDVPISYTRLLQVTERFTNREGRRRVSSPPSSSS